jgi:hypothetical protein
MSVWRYLSAIIKHQNDKHFNIPNGHNFEMFCSESSFFSTVSVLDLRNLRADQHNGIQDGSVDRFAD